MAVVERARRTRLSATPTARADSGATAFRPAGYEHMFVLSTDPNLKGNIAELKIAAGRPGSASLS